MSKPAQPDPKPRVLQAEFSAAARQPGELPAPTQVEIAFAGRSNVGKSSLLNRLMNRKSLARTSSTPGCTRQINFFAIETSAGTKLTLVDLPGYGYAQRSKHERASWGELIDSYITQRPTLRAVALLVDVRRGLEADDLDLLEMLDSESPGRPALGKLVVATKLDKVRASDRASAVSKIATNELRAIGFSCELAETTNVLWNALERAAGLLASARERPASQ
ncbi:MAG TPA: ribosome biogenesis GTP-binding protein YihA/YsxC [Polyangiaceae bacterium]|jgi:GTP-binding protein